MASERATARAIAAARILTGVLFVAEGYGKLTGKFLHGGFAKSAAGMAREGYPFWRPLLSEFVLPRPTAFGWAVALGELLLGLSLLSGLLVRVSSVCGIFLVLSIGFGASFPAPGQGWVAYITGWLLQAAYVGLFLIFAVSDAGRTWGADALRK